MLDLALFVFVLHYDDLAAAIANDELSRLYRHRCSGRPDNKRGDVNSGDDLARHDVSKWYGGGD